MNRSPLSNGVGAQPKPHAALNDKIVADWIRRSKQTSTSTLVDVLDGMGHLGVLSPPVKRLGQSKKIFAGQAYCVRWAMVRKTSNIVAPQPSTWQQVHKFLVPELQEAVGRVYVAGAGPLVEDAALAGGISATYFAQLGFEGLVLGGAIRDPATLADLDLPITATGFVPSDTQGAFQVTETGTSCMIDHMTVHTGDWIVSDEAGTVVIPQAIVEDVLAKAEALEVVEERLLQQLKAGARLPELVEKAERI